MFIVLLKFTENKSVAGQFMDEHNAWIKRGFNDGVFLLAGSLQPNLGGGIMANNITLAELQGRVNEDPLVAENIVSPEIIEISPAISDERMKFLLD